MMIPLIMLHALFCPVTARAIDNPFNRMLDETTSYFKPMAGKIIAIEDKNVMLSLGEKDSVKPGMRFDILREGTKFVHPITGEHLWNFDLFIGRLDIKEVGLDSSTAVIIAGDAKEGDRVRISEAKVNILFHTSKDIDWYISESYYKKLKETRRFNILETDIETDNTSRVIEEARRINAEVALFLTATREDAGLIITQRLFWVCDGVKFSEIDTKIDTSHVKEPAEIPFVSLKEDVRLEINLPFSGKFIAVGDIDGDGKKEYVISTGKDIKVYRHGIGLQPAPVEIKRLDTDNHIWLDLVDLNRDGKDNVFLRRIENGLIAQCYSKSRGFDPDIFSIEWEGVYRRGKRDF